MTSGISRGFVQAYFRACVSRDPERIAAFLHDDVEWSLCGPIDLLPFCGQRSGKAAVVDTLTRLVPSVIRLTKMDLEQILIDGDRAASYMHLTAVHASTGRTVSYRSAQFILARDGKIVDFRGVIDRRRRRAGAWPSVQHGRGWSAVIRGNGQLHRALN